MGHFPPFAETVLPVTQRDSSLAMNAAICAMSSGVPLLGAAAVTRAFSLR